MKVGIKDHMCNYFDDIIQVESFDFDNILSDKKSHENIFIYDFSCKTLIGSKHMQITFDEVHTFIRNHYWTKNLVIFTPEKYGVIFDSIRYYIG